MSLGNPDAMEIKPASERQNINSQRDGDKSSLGEAKHCNPDEW
ncbi:MAG: hypothetical protein R2778_03225 [Saprospiraceae bacterium]